MNSARLNDHDANQGAQSSGEFLGMTGNSGWYLLGSGGATILMVVFLWGIFGISLLLCLFIGIVLCLLSVTYVFALKNNKPEHYDTDFFESALVEAGVLKFSFGPRDRRPVNPFTDAGTAALVTKEEKRRSPRHSSSSSRGRSRVSRPPTTATEPVETDTTASAKAWRAKPEPMVARAAYDRMQEKLTTAEELFEGMLAEAAEVAED